ncbi:unnamed protein product [Closterium sp. Naga37s-1]|nr:unnamed protein product [Closterium sp. Naga37s-1]
MARKAYAATPPEWKKLVEEPVTPEAVVAASGVVKFILWGELTGPPWAVKGIDKGGILASYMEVGGDGTLLAPARNRETCFEACSLQPLIVQEDTGDAHQSGGAFVEAGGVGSGVGQED